MHDLLAYRGRKQIHLHWLKVSSEQLLVWPIREHYIIYQPFKKQKIIIVALIRQLRDVPAIIGENRFIIERELKKINGIKLP